MRRKVLKIELRRAFFNRRMAASFMIGCGISILLIFHYLLRYVAQWNEMAFELKGRLEYPAHVFNHWICGNTYNLEGFLYFVILPLLAVLPHSLSFYEDRKNGYIRQVYTRSDREIYLVAKYVSVFLAGGAAVVLPLLVNLCICMTLLPGLPPQNAAGTLINASVLWYTLYEKVPILYVLLFLIIDFIFAGLVAGLPLFLSFYSERKSVILLMPFILHIFIYSVCMMTALPSAVEYAPVYFTFAGIGCPSGWLLVGYGLAYFAIGGVLYWLVGKREDVF